jgi:predicted HicB family RNase H-like nuclease
MTTKKNESQFGNDAVDAMFSQKEDQTPESKQTAKQGDATRSNTSSKLNNQSVKQTNTTVEPRSQRKQFLFTKTTSSNMKLLANAKNISVNEMVNEVMEQYIQDQFKNNPKLAEASKLINSNQ